MEVPKPSTETRKPNWFLRLLVTISIIVCIIGLTHSTCPRITADYIPNWENIEPPVAELAPTEPTTWQERLAQNWQNGTEAASSWTRETTDTAVDWSRERTREVTNWWQDTNPLEGEKTVITQYLASAKRYCTQ